MYKLVTFDKEENYIRDFLKIPKELYSKSEIVQNEKEERELLTEKHLLSKYFKIYKFIVYKEMKACARCILTFYPGDDCSYIGFFESINDSECTRLLFEEVSRLSRVNKCKKIKGPVDSSFWIKYRLKIDNFDKKAYVSEPYNKEYYLELFLASGYRIAETYVTNYYEKPPMFNYTDKKSKERYDKFISKGYHISSPSENDYDVVIREIYKLLMELYNDFPVFKSISEEDFVQQFGNYRRILDFSFVKVAYYKDIAVGFVISMPDYGNMLYGKIGFVKYVKLLFKKIRSSNYVLLYMGVKPEHCGLGNAMVQTMIKNVQKKRSTAIGALIKEGKVTQGYVYNKIISSNTYALLDYDLRYEDSMPDNM
jgi:hypothetical protein